MKKIKLITLAIILISFLIGIFLYPMFPEKIASHWNAQGQVNGYTTKFLGLFLVPIISLFLFFLFILIPKIDPYKKNIEKFRKYYNNFILLIILFLFYIHLLTILWNTDIKFNLMRALSPAFAILFYYTGILITNAKRNWFIGIRTPWTLSSEKVWNKTHKIGGKLFKLIGIISLLGILFPNYAIWFILVPVIITTIYLLFYSYFEFKKIK
jgi:uncharacterized membrane protein